MNEENFDLGLELANLLTRSAVNSGGSGGGHSSAGAGSSGGSLQQQAVGDGNFDTLLNALAPYLSGAQVQRLNKALELAELLRSARQILPKIGGVVGI
jgi:hypothetical protein